MAETRNDATGDASHMDDTALLNERARMWDRFVQAITYSIAALVILLVLLAVFVG